MKRLLSQNLEKGNGAAKRDSRVGKKFPRNDEQPLSKTYVVLYFVERATSDEVKGVKNHWRRELKPIYSLWGLAAPDALQP
jgi:hypothetical protein